MQKEKPSKCYLNEEMGGKVYPPEEPYSTFLEEDDEDYVCGDLADLAEVYEEADIQEALATYQVRKALRDQRNSRGAWGKSGGKGGGKSFPGPFRARNDVGTKRIHVEMLKLRTKCARCGQIGHWAKECRNPQDSYARSKSEARAGSSGTGSAKSGFFQCGD